MSKIKIAILGAGPSGLNTAFYLSSTAALRAKYEITVYQMGWKAGGKGSSGRAENGSIEEHGLHILFGFYQNFFKVIREVYANLDRPPNAPLSKWREAFVPRNIGVVEDFFKGRWYSWTLLFPFNGALPGTGEALNSTGDYLSMLFQGMVGMVFGPNISGKFSELLYGYGEDWADLPDTSNSGSPDALVFMAIGMIQQILKLANKLDTVLHNDCPRLMAALASLTSLLSKVMNTFSKFSARSHRFWMGVDFFLAATTGIIRDGVFLPGGMERLDEWDYREWLRHHGAEENTLNSPYVRAVYDAAFSYVQGEAQEQKIAAGTAFKVQLRLMFTYKASQHFKMTSGMGDIVFGPIYEVLKKRGVIFKFFHKVKELHLSSDHKSVESIEIIQQVHLKSGDPASYEPLREVKGYPTWPSAPLYDQIQDADAIRDINLESYYSGWDGVEILTLQKKVDFDEIVYSSPIATIPFLFPQMLAESKRWRDMVEHVVSVQTLAFQVWYTETLEDLGWKGPSPLLSLFVEPLNTWSDMTQVLPSEDWDPANSPKNLAYYTGAQVGPEVPPPATDQGFPERELAKARASAMDFMRQNVTALFPNAVDGMSPPEVDWSKVFDPEGRRGEDRFEAQYWRSNCGPSERCTLALPGSNKFRISAGDTDLSNLTVAGDWTANGINAACMEGAFISGILAARAISGEDFPIIGETLDKLT